MPNLRKQPRNIKELHQGYALTVTSKRRLDDIVNDLLQGDLVEYVVWADEYGREGKYHHFHIHIQHLVRVRRGNKYWDNVLGAHPHIQRVGTSFMDKRRLWAYYMKEGDWGCAAQTPAKTKSLKMYIEDEVSLGEAIREEAKQFRDHSPERKRKEIKLDAVTEALAEEIVQRVRLEALIEKAQDLLIRQDHT